MASLQQYLIPESYTKIDAAILREPRINLRCVLAKWACPVPKIPVQPDGRLPVGATCYCPPIYIFPTPTWSPKTDRMTDENAVKGLRVSMETSAPARPKEATSLAKLKGHGWHPRGGLQAAPATLWRVGPTRSRAWQAARSRAKPRAGGRLQSVAASGQAPEAQVYTVPAANVVLDPQPVPKKGGRSGIWQGNIARVDECDSSNQK